jgi:hypothetical protein
MGKTAEAERLQKESLDLFVELDHFQGISETVRGLAHVATARSENPGQSRRAACLFGAAERLRETLGSSIPTYNHPEYQAALEELRNRLGEDRYEELWARGRKFSRDSAIDFALEK